MHSCYSALPASYQPPQPPMPAHVHSNPLSYVSTFTAFSGMIRQERSMGPLSHKHFFFHFLLQSLSFLFFRRMIHDPTTVTRPVLLTCITIHLEADGRMSDQNIYLFFL